jgi:serine protease Do
MIPAFGEIGESLRRSTVQVRDGRRSGGSGVIWNSDGLIVTNAHVARSSRMTVELWDGRTYPAELQSRDARRDLASLRLADSADHERRWSAPPARQLPAATAGDSGRLRAGELVIAVGNPLGFTGALSTGVVHALGPLNGVGRRSWVQAAIRLAPGNSGGPLADALGRVVGINTMVVGGGLALAVPVNTVEQFLRSGPPVELGVTVQPVRLPAARPGIGLVVIEVAGGSPAESASLRMGDVLIGANGQPFQSPDDLSDAIERSAGEALSIEFVRGEADRKREVSVRLDRKVAV